MWGRGAALGFAMDVLDIGGGFCAGPPNSAPGPDGSGGIMGGVPAAVNAALDAHFPAAGGVRVIAEPGRYFAEGAATLACMVYGVRDGAKSGACAGDGTAAARDYWITDGERSSLEHSFSVQQVPEGLCCTPRCSASCDAAPGPFMVQFLGHSST